MKTSAYFLTKFGKAESSFHLKEFELSDPSKGMVTVEVEAFGLNFADIVARHGQYRGTPPLPCIIGYECVGKVVAIGDEVDPNLLDQRVLAFTRFGSYSKHVNTWDYAVVPVNDEPAGELLALTTQGVTAYYMASYLTSIYPGDQVLIHAAAGGVGTILIQLAKIAGATVYAKVGSDTKMEYVKKIGADFAINYRSGDYHKQLETLLQGKSLDVSFNPAGGSTFKKDMRLLGAGGKIILYGGSELSGTKLGILSSLNFVRKMGVIIPAFLMMKSKNVLGVNMLEIADAKPDVLERCLNETVKLYQSKLLRPVVGNTYENGDVLSAHSNMESGTTTGKLIVKW